jgi:hypothetical protein
LIAIALLSLQMFTICGHLLLYQFFVYRSDKLFNDRIGKNMYNVHDLVLIKVPSHTGVTQSWNYFEKVNGQIRFKNTCYNYVKLMLTRDTIYLMCIPNYEKTRLFNQNIINASHIADILVNKKDHVLFGKTIDIGKYNYPITLFKFSAPITILQSGNIICCTNSIQYYTDTPHQPPKMFC